MNEGVCKYFTENNGNPQNAQQTANCAKNPTGVNTINRGGQMTPRGYLSLAGYFLLGAIILKVH